MHGLVCPSGRRERRPVLHRIAGRALSAETLRQERSAMTSSLVIRLLFVNPQDVVAA